MLNSPDENWLMSPAAGIEFTATKTELKLPADFMKMTTTSDNRDFGADIKLVGFASLNWQLNVQSDKLFFVHVQSL